MTCSLVMVDDNAATALEILSYFCPLPTTRAPDGAVVRLAASARETRLRNTGISFMLLGLGMGWQVWM